MYVLTYVTLGSDFSRVYRTRWWSQNLSVGIIILSSHNFHLYRTKTIHGGLDSIHAIMIKYRLPIYKFWKLMLNFPLISLYPQETWFFFFCQYWTLLLYNYNDTNNNLLLKWRPTVWGHRRRRGAPGRYMKMW